MKDYKKLLLDQKIELISPYTGCKIKHEMKCLICNNIFFANILTKIQNYNKYGRNGCPYCWKHRNSTEKNKKIDDLIKDINSNGYTVLSEFKGLFYSDDNDNTLVKKKSCGHAFNARLLYIKKTDYSFCKICSKSNKKILLRKGFSKHYINGIEYYLKDKLVIFIHDINHITEQKVSVRNWMLDLNKQFLEMKILHFYSDELNDKPDLILHKIKHINNENIGNKIYARQCIIKECSTTEKSLFLEETHIQGNDKSQINYGAYYNDELVAVMTFCKPRVFMNRNPKDGEIELSRFSTKKEYRIVGIASKLLSHFKKNNEYNQIISYSDRRWSEGNLYYKLGFKLSNTSRPGYFYIVNNERIYRWNFRKDLIAKKFPESFDPNLTEYQNMLKLGIDRVWDCGTLKFVLSKE